MWRPLHRPPSRTRGKPGLLAQGPEKTPSSLASPLLETSCPIALCVKRPMALESSVSERQEEEGSRQLRAFVLGLWARGWFPYRLFARMCLPKYVTRESANRNSLSGALRRAIWRHRSRVTPKEKGSGASKDTKPGKKRKRKKKTRQEDTRSCLERTVTDGCRVRRDLSLRTPLSFRTKIRPEIMFLGQRPISR